MITQDCKLRVTHNSLGSKHALQQMIQLKNDYYDVTLTYDDYIGHKKAGSLDKSRVKINITLLNAKITPDIITTTDGRLMVSQNSNPSENDLIIVKSTIKQITDIIDQCFNQYFQ